MSTTGLFRFNISKVTPVDMILFLTSFLVGFSYVHGRLPYELIKPDAELRELLLGIPQTKIVRVRYRSLNSKCEVVDDRSIDRFALDTAAAVYELGQAAREEGAAEVGHRGRVLPAYHLLRDDESPPLRGRDRSQQLSAIAGRGDSRGDPQALCSGNGDGRTACWLWPPSHGRTACYSFLRLCFYPITSTDKQVRRMSSRHFCISSS